MADRLRAEVHGARFVEIPDAYHHLVLDQPEPFVHALRDFLDDLDADEGGADPVARPVAS
jgi:pimeloyl-ACP methyl ester carboxylesterase